MKPIPLGIACSDIQMRNVAQHPIIEIDRWQSQCSTNPTMETDK